MPDTVNPEAANKAIEEGTKAFPKFAPMKPRVDIVKLFRGNALTVKYDDDKRQQGDPDIHAFEKVVLKTYRALTGER